MFRGATAALKSGVEGGNAKTVCKIEKLMIRNGTEIKDSGCCITNSFGLLAQIEKTQPRVATRNTTILLPKSKQTVYIYLGAAMCH